jgi:hypothetical protein
VSPSGKAPRGGGAGQTGSDDDILRCAHEGIMYG